jgi:hypothetical protein
MALIGVLGLTPFLTAYAYGRNVCWALRSSPGDSRWMRWSLFALGAAMAVGVPLVLNAAFGDVLTAWIERIPFPRDRFLF